MTFEKILNEIPQSLVQGNSLSWSQNLAEFPASAWALSYALVSASNQIIITAAADGDNHLVEISPATSAAYVVGKYEYHKIITKLDGSEKYKLGSGTFEILVDFAGATTGHDARSFVKKTLDAIEELISGKILKDRASYAVHGRQLSVYSWEEIHKLYSDFKTLYAKEVRKKRGGSSSVKVVFK